MWFARLWFVALISVMPMAILAADPIVMPHPLTAAFSPDVWRREHRLIDVHQHIEGKPERLARAVGIMDHAGIGVGVILGAGTVTHKPGEISNFQAVKRVADETYPSRFLHAMLLDYAGWNDSDWSTQAAQQIQDGYEQGAVGLKEFKRLGLYLKDKSGTLIKIDDPKLDAVWQKCGELGMPVSIHVGDPQAFWLPYDETNERWTELKDHKNWWFGDANRYPPRMDLLEALDRVMARHPKTTFICVHFANNPEDLEWVDQALTKRPNMYADLAARVPEIGRHDPVTVRELFLKHQDRILFATDFMVYGKLILGSGGDEEKPTDDEAVEFYRKHWRWFETADRDWPHMTPIQGDWTISSINLPPEASRKIYFDNAQRLFAKSLPLSQMKALRIEQDFIPDGKLSEPEWADAKPIRLEYHTATVRAYPELSTPVRALWSDQFLYLAYESPYTELSVFSPTQTEERFGLWDNDVVEAFIAPDPGKLTKYTEYEWAPNGEVLDLKLDLPEKDFAWSSGAEHAVTIDEAAKVWRVEVRIPWSALCEEKPKPGTRWRANFYRFDKQHKAFLASSPTLTPSFHTPERFGWLEF